MFCTSYFFLNKRGCCDCPDKLDIPEGLEKTAENGVRNDENGFSRHENGFSWHENGFGFPERALLMFLAVYPAADVVSRAATGARFDEKVGRGAGLFRGVLLNLQQIISKCKRNDKSSCD